MALKYFRVDSSRHDLVVEAKYYQMGLTSLMKQLRENDPGLFVEDGIYLPGWSKFVADPIRGKGFFVRMLEAVFLAKHNHDELNIDFQLRKSARGPRIAMMFVSGSCTNKNFEIVLSIVREALPGFVIHPVYGDGEEGTKGDKAEKEAQEIVNAALKSKKSVLLLSKGMGARSFSIRQISELYLAYDNAELGATIQRISRAFTPDVIGKLAYIISLSFDPNRDDKFDTMLLETAKNYKKNKNMDDIYDALKIVIKTVDIFRCTEEGAVKIQADDYLKDAQARGCFDRVIGRAFRPENYSKDLIAAIASYNVKRVKSALDKAQTGKKFSGKILNRGSNQRKTPKFLRLLAKCRENIVFISEHLDVIYYFTGVSLEESFKAIDKESKSVRKEIGMDFDGIPYDLIKELYVNGILNKDLLQLKYRKVSL